LIYAAALHATIFKGELLFDDLSQVLVNAGCMTHTQLPTGSYLDVGTLDALLLAGKVRQQRVKQVVHAAE
jgi:hypothetical protein